MNTTARPAVTRQPVRPALLIDTPENTLVFGKTGPRARVVRHVNADRAELQLRMYTLDDHAALIEALTADQCEAMAHALLDAAHDLRTNPGPARAEHTTAQGETA